MLTSPTMARVSVIIPVFNGAATVGRAIASALAQSYDGSLEVIAVNDGSTDATAEVLAGFGDRLRVIDQDNRGPAAARNAGALAAHGEYLAFLDADDEWLDGMLAATVPILDANPAVVLVFCDALAVDAAGHPAGETYVTPACAHAPSMAELLERWWPIIPSTTVMRRAAFAACGGFAEEFRSAAYEDPYLFLLAREQGEFAYVPRALVRYRHQSPGTRMEKYVRSREVFIRRVSERYGDRARGLIRGTQRAYASALGYEGLIAMRAGDRLAARRYFARAIRERPLDLKHALRLLRTFLPAALARALSGRTGRAPAASARRAGP
ncbi:MAG: glycosyltransferase family 2 protein [Candidatus Binataceae bacterium]|nr:glycosyltransferase family 2 protein [Candidatus Binataceae bacterium]